MRSTRRLWKRRPPGGSNRSSHPLLRGASLIKDATRLREIVSVAGVASLRALFGKVDGSELGPVDLVLLGIGLASCATVEHAARSILDG